MSFELTNYQNELVTNHLYVVSDIIKYKIHRNENVQGLGYDDLFQTGCLALCRAASFYNPEKGASFKTFASKVITNKLMDHCKQINLTQSHICYLNAPCSNEITFADRIIDERAEKKRNDIEDESLELLSRIRKDYSGIVAKGMAALELKCRGYSGVEIAAHFGVKPNHVAAWISRAGSKLKKDKRILNSKIDWEVSA